MEAGVPGVDRAVADVLARFGADEDQYWDLVDELASRSDEGTFRSAERLTRSRDPRARAVGLDLLGRLGAASDHPWKDETIPIAVAASSDENVEVVLSAIGALGQLGDERGLGAILQKVADPRVDVRRLVAWAIPWVVGLPPDPLAVRALIELSRDEDDAVRDWATFGLGSQIDFDGESVRAALWARLRDAFDDARDEALVGLARRHDPGALEVVQSELAAGSCGQLVFQACAYLADSRLFEALASRREEDPDDSDLLDAHEACDPARQAERLARQQALLRELERSAGEGPGAPTVTMYCGLFEPDVLLQVGPDDDRVWNVDNVLKRAEDDPIEASRFVLSDRADGVS